MSKYNGNEKIQKNNGNLLLESGEILKQKWHKTIKNGMLKLTCIKAL